MPLDCGHHCHQSAAVTWLLLTSALIQSDQNLLAPNLSACAQEFALTPQEKDEKLGGLLAAALSLKASLQPAIVTSFPLLP